MQPGATLATGATLAKCMLLQPAGPFQEAIARVVMQLSVSAVSLAALLAQPALSGKHGASAGSENADGDDQKALDVVADALFMQALRLAPVAVVVSEESDAVISLDRTQPLAVAIDPLDGSSNLDINAPVGTIFSIFPHVAAGAPEASFLRSGKEQVAAGFFIYGPQTSLVLGVGEGVHLFTLDHKTSQFILVTTDLKIPTGVAEYAINASNYRHWHEPVQRYIDDCIQGSEGPRGQNFNMRWVASLVADTYRIFSRGGVFLYPDDKRKGYERGRLRHLYEANPIAFLARQAGGEATDGIKPILETVPSSIHERIPLVMGSIDKVERVRAYHLDPSSVSSSAPLFGRRGLLRT